METDDLMFGPVTIADADQETVEAFLDSLQTHQIDYADAWDALRQQADDCKLDVQAHQPGALPTDGRYCCRCLTAFTDDDVIVSIVSEATGSGYMICLSCIEELPDWNARAVQEYSLFVDWTVNDMETYEDIYELHQAQAQCEAGHNRG